MRFRDLRARVFGRLRERDFDLRADAVVVAGGNEAGKSTFRSALETILYGFEPATRDAHPLYRWNESAGDLKVEAELELGDGRGLRVERVLQSAGKSRTAEAGRPFEGVRKGNAPLAFLAGMPRKLYQAIYSLELAQLEALQRGEQERVDDLLLPESGALDLRPLSLVRRGLREDRRALWRPDNRGKPAARRLRAELAEARRAAAAAARSEDERRLARRERDELRVRLEGLRAHERELERQGADADYLRQVFELGQRRRRLGPTPDLGPLGPLPLADPRELSREIEELEAELRGPRARLERGEDRLAPDLAKVLAARAEIEAAIAGAAAQTAGRARLAEQRERSRRARDRAARELAQGGNGRKDAAEGATPLEIEAAAALDLGRLRELSNGWAAARATHAARPVGAPRPPWWSVAVGVIGIALFALASVGLVAQGFALPSALVGFAALLAALVLRAPPARPAAPARPGEVDDALGRVSPGARLPETPEELAVRVERLDRFQAALDEAREAESAAAELEAELEVREAAWRDLALRIDLSDSADADLPTRLRDALQEARARVETDDREREDARGWIARLAPRLERRREHLRRVEAVLRAVEPDVEELGLAYARVREREREAGVLSEREMELASDPRWEAVRADPRVAAATAPADAPWLPTVSDRREAELVALNEQIRDADTRMGALGVLLERGDAAALARAEDRVLEIEEALRDCLREHDRLALLEAIVAKAERDFREAHQPDVLRRASAYLARATAGRYARLDYLEGPDAGLYATCTGAEEPVPVGHPISRGTLDQIYLCLRLGLLDHLDEGRERLPLVLDDALVRMDDERRPEVYRLLAELAPTRQIFLLTCHNGLAAEACTALKARRIDLAPQE